MKNKKAAAFAVSVILTLNLVLPVGVSADEAVSISTVSDFKSFTEQCVYDEYSRNKKFVLQNDIDLGGEEIKCAEVFCGTFEGGGHSITNLKITAEGSNKGLFAVVNKDGVIKDLNVTGEIKVSEEISHDTRNDIRRRASSILSRMDITTSDDEQASDTKGTGGIAGYNAGKIVNCSFGGRVRGQSQVGGIAGTNAMTGIIDSCANGAELDGDTEIGGLAGYNEGRVKLCKNTGKICPNADEHTVNIGGITGDSEGALVACTNEGLIGGESFGDNVGGISGKQSGEIRECVNNGEVQGRRSVGGICGRFEPYTDIELSYESAKAALDKQIDTFNDDVENARKRIVDLIDELTDGKGIISDVLDRLGIKEGSTGERLDRITDSSTRMMNSITGAVDNMSDKNVAGSLKESLDSVKSFSDEAKTSVRDVSDSLDTSLDSLNDFLDEFDGKGQEITDTLNNLNDSLDKGSDDIDEIKDKLFEQMDDLEADLDDVQKKLSGTNATVQSAMRSISGASSDISDLVEDVDDSVVNTQKEIQRIKTAIENLRKNVQDKVDEAKGKLNPLPGPSATADLQSEQGYEVEPDASLDSDYEVEPSVVGAVIDMLAVTAYAAKDDDDDNKSLFGDLLSTDTVITRLIGGEGADTALVKYCINNGSVSGSELTGGVAGSMGFESAVKNGESITLPNGTRVDSDAVLKALLEDCISYGDVTAKTDYAGGAAGKCDIGIIRNTLTTGEVEATDGSYAGGIAGLCSGDIESCIAINDITGKSYIGGIAGSGKNIANSYSLARLDGTKEYSGAVAGFASGEVKGTYFIDEGLSGINGANLEGRAEAVAPENIAVSDGRIPEKMPLLTEDDYYMASDDLFMPQIKALARNDAEEIGALLQSKSAEMARFHFNVTFVDKGKELKALTVDYGTVLASSDIPRLTADGNEVPMWDKDTKAPIVRHTKFTTEYNKAATTLSSGEEPPVLLVESIFDEGTEVTLKSEETDHEFSGYKRGEAYSFTLSKNAYDVIKVHIRDEKKKAAKIAVQENGKWTVLDCTIDGSYAVFTVGAPCKFVVLYEKGGAYAAVLIACTAAALAAVGAIVFILIRRKRYEREEEEDI